MKGRMILNIGRVRKMIDDGIRTREREKKSFILLIMALSLKIKEKSQSDCRNFELMQK